MHPQSERIASPFGQCSDWPFGDLFTPRTGLTMGMDEEWRVRSPYRRWLAPAQAFWELKLGERQAARTDLVRGGPAAIAARRRLCVLRGSRRAAGQIFAAHVAWDGGRDEYTAADRDRGLDAQRGGHSRPAAARRRSHQSRGRGGEVHP